ncbi:M24 family metallopeptidase [Pontivivens insulae]|uniref:Putative dipeptidase PepE n=1 Tax=Pontivivens insulae TaxID=1639689 RepID=A0A2R8A921_9RHOB|nr:Xaa-Pro peptidase family protein [Pontivivens insulae]RED18747.1 Xaa-Pro aminopeptidase [Pontivivens insulae]SPF28645.1 putative dipeptidase PepE [Pontivivens insulae]
MSLNLIAPEEFAARHDRARSLMRRAGLDGLLLTTPADICYFTGFLTRFWESPTRPWFLIVPVQGPTVAVIPQIGAALMRTCAVGQIRTWRAPDLEDDGTSLLQDTLIDSIGAGGRVGVPSGHETHLRMPLHDWSQLRSAPVDFRGDAGVVRTLRMTKSTAEIELIRATCAVADRAFARVPSIARAGDRLSDVFRRFQMLGLEEGADWVPYLAGAAGQGGYADVISPATDEPLMPGDVLMLDTGLIRRGYFCDFDRNYSVGAPTSEIAEAHRTLIAATEAGRAICRPGNSAADIFHAMDKVLTGGAGGADVGRYGHGLGLQLTEAPSLMPMDATELTEGMVLTLEPSLVFGPDRMMVHEENIVITADGAHYLSSRAGDDLLVLDT